MFTLPVSSRPSKRMYANCHVFSGTPVSYACFGYVESDGTFKINANVTGSVYVTFNFEFNL